MLIMAEERIALATIAQEWARIGCLGFGGPPAHISMLRSLCVERRAWISAAEFEDGIAACNLLPGPASTQLAIFCAWRLRGRTGAVIGGLCFILPGLAMIVVLSAVFFASDLPRWLAGAAAGAGAAVAAVAVHAAATLMPASWQRARHHVRWLGYVAAGALAAATIGPWLVLVLIGCGAVEVAVRRPTVRGSAASLPLAVTSVPTGGLAALAWVAFKVGALSYGGGFVIIPLMQADAVRHYHWMSDSQFLNAVALGQITPGPVVHTVAAVGFAAAGVPGALLAALVAFGPSFVFVLGAGARFDRLRTNAVAQAFLDGTGPAAIGAIAGSAITLARSLNHAWQWAVLGVAVIWLLALRRGVVSALLGAAVLGVCAALLDLPV